MQAPRPSSGCTVVGARVDNPFRPPIAYAEPAATFAERCFDGVGESADGVAVGSHGDTVDEQVHSVGNSGCTSGNDVGNFVERAELLDARESFDGISFKLVGERAPLRDVDVDEQSYSSTFGVRCHGTDDVGGGMLFYFATRHRRKGSPDSSKEQAQVVVDFGRCADGASRIAGCNFLFDGNSRREPFDEVAFRFSEFAEKLTSVSRQAFDVSALTFSVERIERQRRLAGAGKSGDDHETISWNLDVDVFQVVDFSSFNNNIAFSHIMS